MRQAGVNGTQVSEETGQDRWRTVSTPLPDYPGGG